VDIEAHNDEPQDLAKPREKEIISTVCLSLVSANMMTVTPGTCHLQVQKMGYSALSSPHEYTPMLDPARTIQA
jgi:hypothetical protein